MRCLLSVLVLVLCAPIVRADDVTLAKAKAKATLAITQAARERAAFKVSTECQNAAKAALEKCKLEREEREGCMTDLGAASAKASAEGKVLFVWVGMTCEPSIRKEFPQAVHCHVDSLNGYTTPRLAISNDRERWSLPKEVLNQAAIPQIRQLIERALRPPSGPPPRMQSRAPVMLPGRNC